MGQRAPARHFFSRIEEAETGRQDSVIQTKLTMGAPGDRYEREADAVADRVVQRMDSGNVSSEPAPAVQAKCDACREEEQLRRKPEQEESRERLQAKSDAPVVVPDSVHYALHGGHSGGQPIQSPLREEMEFAFDRNFANVRVHTGSSAENLNRDLSARAFTYGTDIYFNSGEFRPETPRGRHLLAHELTHVVQQGAAAGGRPQVQRDEDPDAGTKPPPPTLARDLTADDEKNCSTLYLQKLCVFIEAGLNGDRSGPPPEGVELHGYNERCRKESGYPDSEPDVDISDSDKAMLRSPKCDRGNPAEARRKAHDENRAKIVDRAGKYILGGAAQEFIATLQDPIFIGSVVVALVAYALAWLAPEPVFTKIAAALTTIALLSTGLFSISTIKNILQIWMDLESDADTAQTDEQIEAAAKRFGSRLGAVDMDCLIFIASLLAGGKLKGPKTAPPPSEALAGAGKTLGGTQPNGVVIEGPWGKAAVKPAEPPLRAMFDENGSPLKIDFAPQPNVAPAPAPTPAPAPAPAPAPGQGPQPIIPVLPGVGPKKDDQDPPDRCLAVFQLKPKVNDRWSKQRAPINGNITVSDAAFRLDGGVPAPAGQDTTPETRRWVRAIGKPTDDAGHVIANRFGGTVDFNSLKGNIFPQDLSQNRGSMRSLDAVTAEKHQQGGDACVHIVLNYDNATALRPSSVTYTLLYRTAGAKTFNPPIPATIPNP